MIKAKNNKLISSFYKWYVPFIIKKEFNKVVFHNVPEPSDMPELILMNHTGWWDPFMIYYANSMALNKKFYVMMLENELKKRPLLAYGGCYSIKKKSRSIIESLSYTRNLLNNKDNLVLLFPQGKIESVHVNKINFENGIQFLLKGMNDEVRILFSVLFIEYFSERKPTAHIFFNRHEAAEQIAAPELENAFNVFYNASKKMMLSFHE